MPLDIYDEENRPGTNPSQPRPRRPYISIFFDCCQVFSRIYRQPEDRVYIGRCPRCLRTLTVRVAPDGTPTRIFRAS